MYTSTQSVPIGSRAGLALNVGKLKQLGEGMQKGGREFGAFVGERGQRLGRELNSAGRDVGSNVSPPNRCTLQLLAGLALVACGTHS